VSRVVAVRRAHLDRSAGGRVFEVKGLGLILGFVATTDLRDPDMADAWVAWSGHEFGRRTRIEDDTNGGPFGSKADAVAAVAADAGVDVDPEEPWRDVVHIEERTGPRGGRYWELTLDVCGHLAFRTCRPLGIEAACGAPGGRGRRITAPDRVRCRTCCLLAMEAAEAAAAAGGAG
jgi:hypothetical protein